MLKPENKLTVTKYDFFHFQFWLLSSVFIWVKKCFDKQ